MFPYFPDDFAQKLMDVSWKISGDYYGHYKGQVFGDLQGV